MLPRAPGSATLLSHIDAGKLAKSRGKDAKMLNINEENNYYPGGQSPLIEYLLGDGNFKVFHEEEPPAFVVGPLNRTDLRSQFGTHDLSLLIEDELERFGEACLHFRCDFDFNMLPGEEPSAEKDMEEVEDLFQKYCGKNGTHGFLFRHLAQNGEVDGSFVPLTKHVHILYPDVSDETFSEFLHKRL